eukprot:5078372-Prymnesium_polylepis.2
MTGRAQRFAARKNATHLKFFTITCAACLKIHPEAAPQTSRSSRHDNPLGAIVTFRVRRVLAT